MLSQIGLDTATLTRDFVVQSLSSRDNNAIRAVLDRELASKLQSSFDKLQSADKEEIVIPEKLTFEEENKLSEAYPQFGFKFLGKSNNAHAFAAASRRIEYAVLLRKVDYNYKSVRLRGRDKYLLDIGGDFAKHLIEGRTEIHSCCPILDNRDAQRCMTRLERLKRFMIKKSGNLNVAVESFTDTDVSAVVQRCISEGNLQRDVFCTRRAECCSITAHYAIMVHSSYDIDLRTLGDIMAKRGINELYGSFIYDDRLLIYDQGLIPDLNCYFRYSPDKKNIEFFFKNDASLSYVHSVVNYFSYLTINQFMDSDAKFGFVLELQELVCGIQYFKVTKIPGFVLRPTKLSHFLWFKTLQGATKVVYFDLDYEAVACRDMSRIFVRKVAYIDTSLVEKIRAHAYSSTEAKFKPVELFNFILSYTGRMFFGNDVVNRMEPLSTDDAIALANAAYIDIFVKKYDQGKVVQKMLEDIQFDRKLAAAGLFGKMFMRKTSSVNLIDSPVTCIDRLLRPLHRLVFTYRRSPLLLMKFISENVKFQECSSKVPSCCLIYFKSLFSSFARSNSEVRAKRLFSCIPETMQISEMFSEDLVVDPLRLMSDVFKKNFGFNVVCSYSPYEVDNVVGEPIKRGVLKKAIKKIMSSCREVGVNTDDCFEKLDFDVRSIRLFECFRAFKTFNNCVDTVRGNLFLNLLDKFNCYNERNFICLFERDFSLIETVIKRVKGKVLLINSATSGFNLVEDQLERLNFSEGVDLATVNLNYNGYDYPLSSLFKNYYLVDVRVPSWWYFDFLFDCEGGSFSIHTVKFHCVFDEVLPFISEGSNVIMAFRSIEFCDVAHKIFKWVNMFKDFDLVFEENVGRVFTWYIVLVGYVGGINWHLDFDIVYDKFYKNFMQLFESWIENNESLDKIDSISSDSGCKIEEKFSSDESSTGDSDFKSSDFSDHFNSGDGEASDSREMVTCSDGSVDHFDASDSDVNKFGLDVEAHIFEERDGVSIIGFYSRISPFSSFHTFQFEYKGKVFTSIQQAYQYYRLLKNNCVDKALKILRLATPYGAMMQSLRVLPEDESDKNLAWKQFKDRLVADLIRAKFSDASLRSVLDGTKGCTLVSLSYHDRHYGNGQSFEDAKANGINLEVGNTLGQLLMAFRDSTSFGSTCIGEVKGDGNCLFYSLCKTDRIDASVLKDVLSKHVIDISDMDVDALKEELSGNSWGGSMSAKVFSQVFNAEVSCVDGEDKVLYKFSVSMPTYTVKLLLKDQHYSFLSTCGKMDVCQPYLKTFNFSPVNVSEVVKQLERDLASGRATILDSFIQTLFKRSSRTPKLCYWNGEDFDEIFGKHLFVNTMSFRCGLHECCKNDGVERIMRGLVEYKYSGTCYFLIDTLVVDLEIVEKCIDNLDLRFYVMGYARLLTDGYLLLAVIFGKTDAPVYSLQLAYVTARSHIAGCDECVDTVEGGAWLNKFTNTFYFCGKSVDACVLPVVELPSVDCRVKILQSVNATETGIFVKDGEAGELNRIELVVSKSVSLIDLENLKRRLTSAFSGRIFESIGIEATSLMDVKSYVDIFRSFGSKIYVQRTSLDTSDDLRVFKPVYRQCITSEDFMINAMSEVRELHRINIGSIISKLKPLHDTYVKLCLGSTRAIFDSYNTKPDYGLFDLSTRKFLIRPKQLYPAYSHGFDGKELIDISESFEGKVVKSGYVSVCKETRVVNSDMLYRCMADVDLDSLSLDFTVTLVEGVPGCGKTSHIINSHSFDKNNPTDVVLTATREAAEDLRNRVVCKFGLDKDDKILRQYYCTCDSFIMHHDFVTSKVVNLWFDEGLMRHMGDIFWCASLSGAKNVYIYGDRAQIPYFDRNAMCSTMFSSLDLVDSHLKKKFLSTTYRCPCDVVVYLNSLGVYKEVVKTTNPVTRSMSVREINGIGDIAAADIKDYVILTFTQQEKLDVARVYQNQVFTIHEYQGKQTSKIALIRLNVKEIAIFESASHCLVALTRHTERFVYYTVKRDKTYSIVTSPVSNASMSKVLLSSKGGGKLCRYYDNSQVPIPLIKPIAPKVFDILKHETCMRDFVQAHGSSNIIPMRFSVTGLDAPLIADPVISWESVANPVQILQQFYDGMFPGGSTQWRAFDYKIFEGDDFYIYRDRVRIRDWKFDKFPKFDCLTPVLRTSCPSVVTNTQKQYIKAFFERNGNVPELEGDHDDVLLVEQLYDRFVSTYIKDKDGFSVLAASTIDVNVDSIENWLVTQPLEVKDAIIQDETFNIFDKELREYSFILKRLPKPKLEQNAHYKFPSPQTIAHHDKKINAIFCPLVREMKKRLMVFLCDDKIIYSDIAVKEFEDLLSVRLPYSKYRTYTHMLEVDMSKYDKSQGRVALLFEVKMMIALGFPPELIPTWIAMHVYTTLVARDVGFSANTFFQRKSGDAMTFFGNTLYLMAVLAHTFDISHAFCMFSGDDSLIFCKKNMELMDSARVMALNFNLEAKLLSFATPYFCSKFLFMSASGRWVVIPDVIKFLIKLGRSDLQSFQHVEEYRVSSFDNLVNLTNQFYYPYLDLAIKDRYKFFRVNTLSVLYRSICTLVSSSELFRDLYYLKEGDCLNPDNSSSTLKEF